MFKLISAIICSAALLSGCGLKGPLYLPSQKAAPIQQTTGSQPAAEERHSGTDMSDQAEPPAPFSKPEQAPAEQSAAGDAKPAS